MVRSEAKPPEPLPTMSFMAHLEELRRRLIFSIAGLLITTVACFTFAPELFELLRAPIAKLSAQQLVVLTPLELFLTYLKLSVVAGIFLACPWWLLQLWWFVAPGLYSKEKRWIAPFVILGTLFFVLGGAFGYYVVLPIGFRYLIEMVPKTISQTYSVESYYALVTTMLMAFGLVFELPLVMWVLSAARIIPPAKYSAMRKYWLVLAFILGGILTPPDPFTQTLMAVPLILFFELGILGARVVYRARSE